MKRLFIIVAAVFLFAGCARVEVSRITPQNPYKEGVRFYRSHPYLLVIKDAEKGLQGSVIWLPKTDEEYVIKVMPGIGSVDAKFTLEGGWNLTQYGETQDAKTADIINALTGSLGGLTKKAKQPSKEALVPGLYIFIFDDKTGFIKDLEPIVQFQ